MNRIWTTETDGDVIIKNHQQRQEHRWSHLKSSCRKKEWKYAYAAKAKVGNKTEWNGTTEEEEEMRRKKLNIPDYKPETIQK